VPVDAETKLPPAANLDGAKGSVDDLRVESRTGCCMGLSIDLIVFWAAMSDAGETRNGMSEAAAGLFGDGGVD